MDNFYKQAAKQAGFVFAAMMFANFFGYLTRTVISHRVSPTDYGLFYAMLTFYMFTAIPIDLGFGTALVKYISHFRALKDSQQLTNALAIVSVVKFCLGIVVATVVFAMAPWLATHYFKNAAALPMVRLVSLIILVAVGDELLSRVLTGFKRMYVIGGIYLSTKGTFFILVLISSFFTDNIFTFLVCFLISMLSYAFFIKPIINVLSEFGRKVQFPKTLFIKLTRFAIPATLNSLGFTVVGYIDVLILTYYRSLAEVGVYNAALPTAMIITYLATSIALVFFPIASELWATKSKKRLNAGIKLLYNYGIFLVIPPAVIMFFFSGLVLKLLFGEAYAAGGPALSILSLGVIMVSLFKINSSVFGGIGKPQETTKILLPAGVFNFVLNLILIPRYGLTGAAITTTLSYLFMMVASVWRVKRFTKVELPWGQWAKMAVIGLVFGTVMFALNLVLPFHEYVNAVLAIGVSGLLYLGMAYVLKVFRLEEFLSLRKH